MVWWYFVSTIISAIWIRHGKVKSLPPVDSHFQIIIKILDGVVFSNFHIFLYNMNLQHFEGVVYFNFQILISYITWIYKILEGWYISISMIPYVTCINEIMVELYIDLNFTMCNIYLQNIGGGIAYIFFIYHV